MRSNSYRPKGWIKLLLLVTLSSMAGCQTGSLTRTTATDKAIAAGVCSQWRDVKYSAKHDTPETILGVRGNNAARDAYCQ